MAGVHRRGKKDPAADLFDRWMTSREEEPAPAPEPAVEAVTEPAPMPAPVAAPVAAVVADPVERPAERPTGPVVGVSTDVEFAPRTAARRIVGWLLLLAVAGLVVAAVLAVQDPTTLTVGVAATMLVLTLALWAIRAASPTTHLAVHSGQLEVKQGGARFVFELHGNYTPIEVVGGPGDRNWKVLFVRRNMAPFVVDSSMVDPHAFMDMLRHYRPE